MTGLMLSYTSTLLLVFILHTIVIGPLSVSIIRVMCIVDRWKSGSILDCTMVDESWNVETLASLDSP